MTVPDFGAKWRATPEANLQVATQIHDGARDSQEGDEQCTRTRIAVVYHFFKDFEGRLCRFSSALRMSYGAIRLEFGRGLDRFWNVSGKDAIRATHEIECWKSSSMRTLPMAAPAIRPEAQLYRAHFAKMKTFGASVEPTTNGGFIVRGRSGQMTNRPSSRRSTERPVKPTDRRSRYPGCTGARPVATEETHAPNRLVLLAVALDSRVHSRFTASPAMTTGRQARPRDTMWLMLLNFPNRVLC